MSRRPVDLSDKNLPIAKWIEAREASVSGEDAANAYVGDASYRADLELAHRWLDGRFVIPDQRGLPKQQHIKDDDQLDYEGRSAFARVMRSEKPVPDLLRHRLAAYAESNERRIVFRELKRGAKRQNLSKLTIALYVRDKVLKEIKPTAACQLVAEEIGLSFKTVNNAWSEHFGRARTGRRVGKNRNENAL
jgi:hypothetical protein